MSSHFVRFLIIISVLHGLLSTFSRAQILDAIPDECKGNCTVVVNALQTCLYGTCFCTDNNGIQLEDCMNCLYWISPILDVYTAAQGALTEFQQTCESALNLTITSVTQPPPSTTSFVPPPSSSTTTRLPSGPLATPSTTSTSTGTVQYPTIKVAPTNQVCFARPPAARRAIQPRQVQQCRLKPAR
ncbi:hypothetical protein M413DRAFT_443033 [Hebeloma cylindrosporum]|uniref:Extracellular membrane protein CFEM domain-containing protein n=1 Tax=Hebeloma cylindrosporum TaxID=76867 RepID=A0A0C2Y274_HEBCY|nr:hypothetical protein M413DRAFT_443033 [Hebeloma cylindrosporum h7]